MRQIAIQDAIGQSEVFLEFQEGLSRVAPVNRPVLLIGERGSGKELAASRLHYLSGRWEAPLVALNCAALTPSLIASELFGYEKGAFTGAGQRHAGRFEIADGGTLFLDEVGNIPMEVQKKILRVVEYGTFERVGGVEPVEVDVRIIAATNANLPGLVQQGQFLPDLLDRLSFEVLIVPPLRFRKGDILLLAQHFAQRMAFELGRDQIPEFSSKAIETLEAYNWPGNVRELKNVVERAVYRSDGNIIHTIDFDPFKSPYSQSNEPISKGSCTGPASMDKLLSMPFKEATRLFEIRMITNALEASTFNQKKAAKRLHLTYDQFRGLYRKYQSELNL